mmetsp:Transcript_28250/g.63991  ORF Transcript_28250/g.63991 Transcript_28250/m.63991 type:complete len:177 (+) Transcript_28250:124-654(+)
MSSSVPMFFGLLAALLVQTASCGNLRLHSAPHPSFVASHSHRGNPNVRNTTLQTCSKPGTALTGFTRTGHCVDTGNDDLGSHHICIEMKSDFCKVTGQGNPGWCASEMPCMDDESKDCKIGNWCVCQWAFAKYIKLAGGCDSIVNVVCDATNMAAYRAYEDGSEEKECLKKRCNLS